MPDAGAYVSILQIIILMIEL